jgi:hypothetical protein
MNSRVKHFIPPKDTLRGEWNEVAGLIHSPYEAYKSNSKRRVSFFLYKSYRTAQSESPGIAARVSYPTPFQRPVTRGQGRPVQKEEGHLVVNARTEIG